MRIALILAYDGTNFCGWQIQPEKRTVQEEIEKAVKIVTGETVTVTASGRTDSGVHAFGQVAHFDTVSTIKSENFCKALNCVLPEDIKALKSFEVSSDFHARFSAKKKTYIYTVYSGDTENPLYNRYATYFPYKIDINKMNEALSFLIGEKDFKAFQATGSHTKDTVRTIFEAYAQTNGISTKITITGNGFLYNMVRIIAGAVLAVACGKLSQSDFEKAIINGKRNELGKTMPAKGLALKNIEYL